MMKRVHSASSSYSSPPLGGEARRGGFDVRRPLSQPLPLAGERRKNYEALSLLLMLVTSLSGRRMMGREVVAGVRVRF